MERLAHSDDGIGLGLQGMRETLCVLLPDVDRPRCCVWRKLGSFSR